MKVDGREVGVGTAFIMFIFLFQKYSTNKMLMGLLETLLRVVCGGFRTFRGSVHFLAVTTSLAQILIFENSESRKKNRL